MQFLTILTGFMQFSRRMAQRMAGWLHLNFSICLLNQLSSIHSIITYERVQMSEKCDHQIDSKIEWLLLSASFTGKFGLVFVLTLENGFS